MTVELLQRERRAVERIVGSDRTTVSHDPALGGLRERRAALVDHNKALAALVKAHAERSVQAHVAVGGDGLLDAVDLAVDEAAQLDGAVHGADGL